MENLKEKIEEIVKKIQNDKNISNEFKKNPIGTVEKLIGIDLSDNEIMKVVDAVKTKLTVDNAKGLFDNVKNLLNK